MCMRCESPENCFLVLALQALIRQSLLAVSLADAGPYVFYDH